MAVVYGADLSALVGDVDSVATAIVVIAAVVVAVVLLLYLGWMLFVVCMLMC